MTVEVSAAIAGLEELIAAVDRASREIAATGARRVGDDARGLAPKKTGALAASIVAEQPINSGPRYAMAGVTTGPYFWTARVGPTVVYGRIREIGGPIPGKKGMGHPYLRWYWKGRPVFRRKVYQKGSHYLLHATDAYEPQYLGMAAEHWAGAMTTSLEGG